MQFLGGRSTILLIEATPVDKEALRQTEQELREICREMEALEEEQRLRAKCLHGKIVLSLR